MQAVATITGVNPSPTAGNVLVGLEIATADGRTVFSDVEVTINSLLTMTKAQLNSAAKNKIAQTVQQFTGSTTASTDVILIDFI